MTSRKRAPALTLTLLLALATPKVAATEQFLTQLNANSDSGYPADSCASRRQLQQLFTDPVTAQAFPLFARINTATVDGPSVVWVRAGLLKSWQW